MSMNHSLFQIGTRSKLKLKQDPDHLNNSFLRKYQELVKQHRTSQPKPKPSIFRSQRKLSLQNLRMISSLSRIKTADPKSSRQNQIMPFNKNLNERAKQFQEEESLEISAIHSHPPSGKANTQNPEMIWSPGVSKISQVQNQSYHNVLISKKLGLSVNTKNDLENLIDKLKNQITKEKNLKFKTIKNVQKMLNKLSDIEFMLEKSEKQRTQLNQQICMYENELFKQSKLNEKLEYIHQRNLKTLKQEKRLNQYFEKHNEQSKASLILEKYHLNITKDNYLIQRNRLLKNATKFEQASNQREKICRSVNKNVVKNAVQSEIKNVKA